MDCPPYFALIAAAPGTGGAGYDAVAREERFVAAVAMLSETSSAKRLTTPAQKTKERGLTSSSFLSNNAWGANRLGLARH
jgi:hypothetical protein